MGKIRVRTLGDESLEAEQKKDAKVRREEKKKKVEQQRHPDPDFDLKSQKSSGEGPGEPKDAVVSGESKSTEAEGTKEKKSKKEKFKKQAHSKRFLGLVGQVDRTKLYSLTSAVELVKKTSTVKFDATVELHVNINAATLPKDKKNLNGSVNLPHGTGKKRVITIADELLIEKIQKGTIDFDVLVAHPSMMPKLAKVAKILGPKGLMPNPKTGTVTTDPEKRVKELEGGEIAWRTEPDHPVIHQAVGKVSFKDEQLGENVQAFVKSIGANKIAKLTLSSSMGPGVKVDIASL